MSKAFDGFALVVALLFFATTTDAADRIAASCSQTDVQAKVTQAADGDRVLIPSGSPCTWFGGIATTKQIRIEAQNYTKTSMGATSRNVTIINNNTTAGTPLIQMQSGNTYHVGIGGIKFQEGTGDQNHFRFTGTGTKPPLAYDLLIEVRNRFGNEPDIAAVAWLAQGGVMWNTRITGVGGGIGGQCCPEGPSFLIQSPRSWETASTMGAADTNGLVNVYIEDSTWLDFGQSPDIDDNGRVVFRHNDLNGVSGTTHGFTSSWGGRHAEYYDNSIQITTDARNTGGRIFWWRAGTVVITGNYVNAPYVGFGDPMLISFGDTWTPAMAMAKTGASGYPIPRQIGGGHNGTNYVVDPIYIWNNTGPDAYTWERNSGGGNWDATYFAQNRDFFINNGAKPGYSKYTYPHPLRSVIDGGVTLLPAPTDLQATPR
jgi:hypothetical protein